MHRSMWMGLRIVSSLERCPISRMSFTERSHCSKNCMAASRSHALFSCSRVKTTGVGGLNQCGGSWTHESTAIIAIQPIQPIQSHLILQSMVVLPMPENCLLVTSHGTPTVH